MAIQQKPYVILEDLPKSKSINFCISSLIGFFSVLVGIGGGSFSVPILSMFSKQIHEAVGTSAVFGFLISLSGVIMFMITGSFKENNPDYSIGYVNIIIVLLVAVPSILTANIGANFASKVNKIVLRRFFSIFLLFTCVSLIIEHFIL